MDDLVQVGRIALLRLWRRFDRERGVPFGGYAQPRLRGSMKDLLATEKSQSRRNRVPDLTNRRGSEPETNFLDTGVGYVDQIEADGPSPEDAAQISDAGALIMAAAQGVLDPREIRIIQLLYGQSKTLAEVGDILGLHESRICQVRIEILRKLKERLQMWGVTGSTKVLGVFA